MKKKKEITKKRNELIEDLDLHKLCEYAITDKETKLLSLMAKNSMEKQIELLEWVLK